MSSFSRIRARSIIGVIASFSPPEDQRKGRCSDEQIWLLASSTAHTISGHLRLRLFTSSAGSSSLGTDEASGPSGKDRTSPASLKETNRTSRLLLKEGVCPGDLSQVRASRVL